MFIAHLHRLICFLILGWSLSSCQQKDTAGTALVVNYPKAFTTPSELDRLDSLQLPATRDWMSQQAFLTTQYLDLLPEAEPLEALADSLLGFHRYQPPLWWKGSYWALRKEAEGQTQIIRFSADLDSNELVFQAPGLLWFLPHPEGLHLAIGQIDPTSFRTRVLLLSGEPLRLTDTLKGLAPMHQPIWWRNRLLYVKSNSEALDFPALYEHYPGLEQSQDDPLFRDYGAASARLQPFTFRNGNSILLIRTEGSLTDILQSSDGSEFSPFIEGSSAHWHYLGEAKGRLFFQTTEGAANGRVVSIDPARSTERNWSSVLPQSERILIHGQVFDDRLICLEREEETQSLIQYNLRGKEISRIPQPQSSTIGAFSRSPGEAGLWYTLSSPSMPPGLVQWYNEEERGRPRRSAGPPISVQRELVEIQGSNGHSLPISLWSPPRVDLDAPLLLIIADEAWHTVCHSHLPLGLGIVPMVLSRGGRVAIAHPRGGNFYGERWALEASGSRISRAMEDVEAAIEWLKREQDAKNLSLFGQGQGAFLATNSLLKKPDRISSLILDRPILSLSRYQEYGLGSLLHPVYGDELADIPIPQQEYPPILVLAPKGDPLLSLSHATRWLARMQARQTGPAPVLMYPYSTQNLEQLSVPDQANLTAQIMSFMEHAYSKKHQ